jgi:uncharacterized protein YbjT (DUF2867 family)
MITVMGATGQTGGATARRLLEAGEHVRALGRSPDGLAALRDAGAEALPVDAGDAAALTEAFRGADAAYVLLPISPEVPDWHAHMARLGEAIVTAVRAAGVPYVVAVSSVGADLPSGTGFLTGLYAQEERLRTLTDVAHALALRPGAYFENAYGWLPVVAEQGVMADSVEPDAPLPMVATRDVGAAAAAGLVDRDIPPGTYVLTGPRAISYAEIATELGAEYVDVAPEAVRAGIIESGLPVLVAEFLVRLFAELRAGAMSETTTTVRDLTGREPRDFAAFARDHFGAVPA